VRGEARRIPIYDATEPIVCTIDGAAVESRLAQIERMRSALTAIDRTEHGLLLHFPVDAEVEADVRRFAVDEKACCAFWGFDVTGDDAEVLLRWDAPPTAGDLLDQILVALEGDEPIATALSGLL